MKLAPSQQQNEKKNDFKIVNISYVAYAPTSSRTIFTLQHLRGEEREKGTQNIFEKKYLLKTSLIWGRKQTTRSKKPRKFYKINPTK